MSTRRGVLAFVLAGVLLGFAVLVVALNLRRPAAARLSAPAVLVFDVPETLSEGPPPARSIFLGPRRRARYTTYDVLRVLRHAADDDQVSGLVLHVGSLDWGWAKIGEVRDAVARFRQAGKPVYASITGGGTASTCWPRWPARSPCRPRPSCNSTVWWPRRPTFAGRSTSSA